MPSRGRTVALGAVVGFLVAWNWIRLEQPPHAGQAIVIGLLALLPIFGGGFRSRLALAAGAFLLAAGNAFGLGVDAHYPVRLSSRLWQGFLEFYDVGLPFDAGRYPHMHGAVLLAVFCFTAAAVLAVASGRAGLAAGALVVGAGWPATLLAGQDLVRGSFILAGVLVLIAGTREKPREPSYAVLAGVVVVLVGGAASTSSALAKQGLLNWKAWDLYTHPAKPVDVSYVWSSNYDGLKFPRKRTVVLRITAPGRPQYWRVTALSGVVDGRWREEPVLDRGSNSRLGEPGLVPPAGNDPSNWVEQKVRVEALQDLRLAAADVPAQFEASNLGEVTYDPAGMAYLARSLRRGDTYTAWSYEPRPTPGQLARSRPVYPRAISRQRKYLEVDWGSWVPPFGTRGQEAAVRKLFASHYQLTPYRPLYREARRVAGGARSPYAAAAALESWFRTGGGFIYDQHPPRSDGRPPLVDFVTRTKTGYCQHFAGAMALMLRYLGIPARVAAGFSSGHYDDGVWVVTDHDAHEWVEVWFRDWGWLPFDPTPGRGGGLAGTYSASSRGFDPVAAALVLGGKDGLSAFARRRLDLGFTQKKAPFFADPRSSRLPAVPTSRSAGHSSGGPGLIQLLPLVLAGLAVALALLKLAVRRARYLTRDPRRLAAACGRELRDVLLDQRIDVPSSATLSELADLANAELGIETAAVGRHATVARFGPPASARAAARELRGAMWATRRSLRVELSRVERGRGLLSLRSLGLA